MCIFVRNPKPREQKEVGNDYIDLGALKGNIGNQNYPSTDEMDLTVYRGIIIYSVQFWGYFQQCRTAVKLKAPCRQTPSTIVATIWVFKMFGWMNCI